MSCNSHTCQIHCFEDCQIIHVFVSIILELSLDCDRYPRWKITMPFNFHTSIFKEWGNNWQEACTLILLCNCERKEHARACFYTSKKTRAQKIWLLLEYKWNTVLPTEVETNYIIIIISSQNELTAQFFTSIILRHQLWLHCFASRPLIGQPSYLVILLLILLVKTTIFYFSHSICFIKI